MRLALLGLVCLHLDCARAQEQAERKFAFIAVTDANGRESQRFEAEIALTGNDRSVPRTQSDAAEPMPLFFDASGNADGCANITAATLPSEPFALLAMRGNCTFEHKARAAAALGAQTLFVANIEDALYGSNGTAEAYLLNPCSTDCTASSADSESACETDDCNSGVCLANPRARAGVTSPGRFCCALNSLLPMRISASEIDRAFFVGIADAGDLVRAASAPGGARVQAFERDKPRVDGSAVVILLLGTIVTALASYRAARKERVVVAWLWRAGGTGPATAGSGDDTRDKRGDDADSELETVNLNAAAVACFLVAASGSLIGLFYLAAAYPRETVIAVQVLFGLGSIYALSYFVLQPIVRTILRGNAGRSLVVRGRTLGTADAVLGYALSVTLVSVWFAFRHAPWAWVLLDLLGASVCVMFLATIRVPTLRIAVLGLGLFFIYDIFMVFITPQIWGGRSVMVDVATAGGSQASVDPSDNTVCDRTVAERMPMLFMVPRFDGQGMALLGLGDVFIPGLLITLAARVDYLKAESRQRAAERSAQGDEDAPLLPPPPQTWRAAHAYFLPLVLSYFVGLFLALTANVLQLDFSTEVRGQPALLYLVPLTAGTFLALAWKRGDLKALWSTHYDELQRRVRSAGTQTGSAQTGSRASSRSGSEDRLSSPDRLDI